MNKVRKSIEYSIKDGICWASMVGFVEPYIIPFAINLGSNNLFIGFLRSIPSLLSSLSQTVSEMLVVRLRSCKKVVFRAVFVQALTIFIISFSIFINIWWAKYFFLLMIIIYNFSGSIASAPWATLMGEYLPANKRGRFFGIRLQIIGVVFFLSSFIVGYFLKKYHSSEKEILFVFFILASFFRFLSAYYVSLMYEPEKKFHIPQKYTHFYDFLSFSLNSYMKKIFTAIFLLLFSVYIAAPYFSVYVLKELKFDYMRYMFLTSFGQVLIWISARGWGRIVDRYGSVLTLEKGLLFIPFISLLWMLTKNFWYLLLVEVFSGFVWGAFSIVYNTIIYEYVESKERTRYTACLIFVMSIAQFLGSIIGGLLYDGVKTSFSPFLLLLGLSTIGRFIALFYFKKVVLLKTQS
ncbi:MAG: MFS transporter [Elusimicrobiales bacterium]